MKCKHSSRKKLEKSQEGDLYLRTMVLSIRVFASAQREDDPCGNDLVVVVQNRQRQA